MLGGEPGLPRGGQAKRALMQIQALILLRSHLTEGPKRFTQAANINICQAPGTPGAARC